MSKKQDETEELKHELSQEEALEAPPAAPLSIDHRQRFGRRSETWCNFLFFVGMAIAVACVLLGYLLEDTIKNTSLDALREKSSAQMGLFFLFAFGTPLGFVIMLVSSLWYSARRQSNLVLYTLSAVFFLSFTISIPHIFGRNISSAYFGAGGFTILFCIIVTFWYWKKYRASLTTSHKVPLDIKAMGYLCFAMAAWNICGFGGPPSFALYPEKMLQLGTHAFAVGQLKAIMAYLVMGWLLTAWGMFKTYRLRHYR